MIKWRHKCRHFKSRIGDKLMDIKIAIQNIGLGNLETRIYITSLEIGESTISDIAKTVDVARSSCYKAIENLILLGLIRVLKIGKRRLYKAENPEKLLTVLQNKETALREVIPRLKSRLSLHNKIPSIFVYEGGTGFKAILNDILERQHPLCSITSIDTALDVLGEDFKEFIEKRYKKHLRVRLLTARTNEAVKLREKDSLESRITKFLPGNPVFTTATFIYGSRIAIVSLNSKNILGTILEDSDIAQTHQTLFEIAWNHSL